MAAPAPFPKPQPAGPWFTGWDKPIDRRKDCRFHRQGERLTISIPGKGHGLDFRRDNGRYRLSPSSAAPLLLRDVEGDFDVQVRVAGKVVPVAGKVVPAPAAGARGFYTADLLLLNGTMSVQDLGCPLANQTKPRYLRLERRGDTITAKTGFDGEQWEADEVTLTFPEGLPKKLKVGVAAASEGDGAFRAEFDGFKLTRPTGPAK